MTKPWTLWTIAIGTLLIVLVIRMETPAPPLPSLPTPVTAESLDPWLDPTLEILEPPSPLVVTLEPDRALLLEPATRPRATARAVPAFSRDSQFRGTHR